LRELDGTAVGNDGRQHAMTRLHNPGAVASVGLGGITLGSAAPFLLPDFLPGLVPTFAIPYVKIVALALVIVGIACVVWAVLTWCLRPLADAIIAIRLTHGRYSYFISQAGMTDLDELYMHYVDLFGHSIVPQPQMVLWLKKNPRIAFRVLASDSKRPHEKPTVVGFFEIEPLTSSGESKLRRPDANTLSIGPSDIKSPRSGLPHAYYVGSVGSPKACGDFHRGITMAFLLEAVRDLCSAGRITVYARPATDVGLYLVKQLFAMSKLQDLPDKEAVWARDIPRNGFIQPREYARYVKYVSRQGKGNGTAR
jgi:hypothetical protein